MKEIKLTKGYVTLVDDDDYRDLSQYKWHVRMEFDKARAVKRSVSVRVSNKRKTIGIYMHRQILGLENYTTPHIDHINMDPLDNRKQNLRAVTHRQNQLNKGKSKAIKATSKYKGVSFCKQRCCWVVYIKSKGSHFNLGGFSSEKAAAVTYNKKAKELFGEYAVLNVIN